MTSIIIICSGLAIIWFLYFVIQDSLNTISNEEIKEDIAYLQDQIEELELKREQAIRDGYPPLVDSYDKDIAEKKEIIARLQRKK